GLGVTAAALVVAVGLGAVLLLPPDPEKAPSSAHLGTGADARDPARAERHAQWMAEGSAALDAGDGPAAVAAFRRIVAESPGRQEARFGLGRAYLLTEQYDAAAAEFTAIEDHATSGPVLAGLAHCWAKCFDYVKAAELYEQALTEGFRTPAVLNNLGYCLQHSHENWPRARDVMLAAVAKDPRFVPAWDGLAQLECKECLRDSERVPDMTFIERALAEESQSRELHFLAAWLYTFSAERSISAQDAAMNDDGNLARALEHCIQAVELGFDPARLRREMERFSALKRDPRFTEALQRPADRNTPEPVQHVVDPLAGLSPAIPLGTRPVSTSPPD
ncbi:MAG: tetratricopeptide repeat protein, partial [Planctomycetaceae bacterium]